MTGYRRSRSAVVARCAVAVAVLGGVVCAGILAETPAGAATLVQQVSSDPLTNVPTLPSGVHHATEVETDTLSQGSTIVSSFQVGRYSAYGASATGWATSTDGGQSWQHGLLPGLSNASPSPNSTFVSVANQSVLYDAAHGTWLIPTVGVISCSGQVPSSQSCVGHVATEHTLMVSRSPDGLNWGLPVTAVASNVDKPWGVCDNSPVSPYYGTCYVAYAQIDDGDRLALVRSTDGGLTWSAPVNTTSGQGAYNAIPVVRPDGRLVIVATDDMGNGGNGSQLLSFVSTDGGATLSDAATGSNALPTIQYHTPAGGIRAKNKPSVAVDAAGTIYVAWGDCRFRAACAENDIVVATSTDGMQYSAPIRVAADAVTSSVDHFIPGLAVRPGTSGSSAELGVVSYSYANTTCTSATCRLNVLFSSSIDGGAHWTTTQLNPTAMQVGWLAPTSLGPAVGDYESVSYSGGRAVTVFPLATAPVSGTYNEAENAVLLPSANGSPITSTAGSGQTAPVGTGFSVPLQATVVNSSTGVPVSGAPVTFSAPGAGASGTFAGGGSTAVVTTNASGVATAPSLTANSTAGTYTVLATTTGGSSGYLLTNAGLPATIVTAPGASPQGAPVGTQYASQLSVTVRDANGAPVGGAAVTFSAPGAGPSGTFAAPGSGSTATVTTNSAGVAQAPTFTAGGSPGAFTVVASAGAASGSFTLCNTASPPSALVLTGGGSQSTTVGQPFASPLAVQVVDSSGQPYPGVPVTFTAPAARVSATFVSSGSNTTTIRTDATGTATVPEVYAGSGAGNYSVTAAVGSVKVSIPLTNRAGPASVVVVSTATNNQSQIIGSPFTLPLKVTVTDSLNNPVGGDSVTFQAPASGPSGTFAGGGSSAVVTTTAAGVAAAPLFTANLNPGAIVVTATAASTSAPGPSNVFTLTSTEPPAITSSASANFALNSPEAFTVSSVGAPTPALSEVGSLPSGVSFVDNGNGTASLSGTPTSPGSYPLTITATNGVGVPAEQAFVLTVASAPNVTGISPPSGPSAGGTTVTVIGSGFTGATSVSFGTAPASSFTVVSDSQLQAVAPPGSATADLTVTTASGTSPTTVADQFTWIAAPTVTAVSPSSGPAAGGTTVTVTGSGFTGATSVSFGATPATTYTVMSDSQLTAVSPPGSATADITVSSIGGTSVTTTADQFTWIAAPAVTAVSPSSGPTAGGTTVTVTGSGFTGTTSVSFGAASATSFTVVSDSQLTAVSPPQAAGLADLTVTTASGTSPTTVADQFTWVSPPAVTAVSPSSGPAAGGTTVTVTGSGFTGATSVSFGTTPASSFTVVSDSQLQAVAPPGSATADLTVTTASGTSPTTVADQFTWIAAPAVTAVSPSSGPTAGGTTVTVTGTGFTGATSVSFGATAATSYTVVSDSQLTAVSPPQAAGMVDVSVVAPGGASPAVTADRFNYAAGVPSVSGIAPASGPAAGGTAVTVTGSGFTGATKVRFGTVLATSFTVLSDTQISATSPPQALGTKNIFVTTSGGTNPAVGADVFTYKAPAPAITGISPASGPITGGTTVTVGGSGFTGATTVRFGSTVATSFTVVSDSQITAVSPAHAKGAQNVVVVAPGGSSIAVPADLFTFMAPVPAITGVSPSSGPTAGGSTVTVTGSGFTGATVVRFGWTDASSFTVVSDSEVIAVTPAHTAGAQSVAVVAPGGTSASVTADMFTYVAPIPAVTAVAPSSGTVAGGTSVTITGSGFTGATKVRFGTVVATSFTVVSDTQITVVSPAHAAGPQNVLVTTAGGTSPTTPGDVFTYS